MGASESNRVSFWRSPSKNAGTFTGIELRKIHEKWEVLWKHVFPRRRKQQIAILTRQALSSRCRRITSILRTVLQHTQRNTRSCAGRPTMTNRAAWLLKYRKGGLGLSWPPHAVKKPEGCKRNSEEAHWKLTSKRKITAYRRPFEFSQQAVKLYRHKKDAGIFGGIGIVIIRDLEYNIISYTWRCYYGIYVCQRGCW